MTEKEALEMLAAFLKKNRVSQVEFAKMIGKSVVTVSRWLNGKQSLTEANINAIRFVVWSFSANDQSLRQPVSGNVAINGSNIHADNVVGNHNSCEEAIDVILASEELSESEKIKIIKILRGHQNVRPN